LYIYYIFLTLDATQPDPPRTDNFVNKPDPTQPDPWIDPTHVQFWVRGDPAEVTKFWCWFKSGCGSGITFPLSLTLTLFYTMQKSVIFAWEGNMSICPGAAYVQIS